MTRYSLGRRSAFLLPVLAAAALVLALVGVAGARPLSAITITDFTPANGSNVPAGQSVVVSAFIVTDTAIALVNGQPDVSVSIDGARATDAQFVVGSRAVRVGFRVSRTFAAGDHTVSVTARNVAGEAADARWTFTAVQAAATTATPAITATPATPTSTAVATPAQLPQTGGVPLEPAIPALLGLSAALTHVGTRLRTR